MERDEAGGGADRPRPRLRLGQVESSQLPLDPELEQGHRIGDRLLHRRRIPLRDQVGGVAARRKGSDPQIEVARHRSVEPAVGGPGAGLVGIEGEHDPVGEPAQQVEMVLPEGGSAGSHRDGQPCDVHGDHVGVSLDNHRLVRAHDLRLGPVEAVQEPRFVIDRRLRRVEVLGSVAFEPTGAEADGVAAHVVDRKHQPIPEAVDQVSPLRPRGQAGAEHRLILDPGLPQMRYQQIPLRRGVPDDEPVHDICLVATATQVAPGVAGVVR